MVSLKNKSKGFTIVELLIVIVVIGILATLVIVTFTGIQQKARDSQRQTDINAIDSHLEAYFASNGNYPSFAQLTDATWRSTNMKGLDPQALVGPKGGVMVQGAATGDQYGYKPTEGGTTACTDSDAACDTFVLTAQLENNSTTYTKKSN